jgi:glucokinase
MAGLTLSFDLGATQLRAGLVDADGRIVTRSAVLTDHAGGVAAVVGQMLMLADRIGFGRHLAEIDAVGVATPGPLDSSTGVVLTIPTMEGWTDVPLRQILAEKFDLPVSLDNDGISAAVGEWKHGAGSSASNLVYVTVSTGIGGGVIADGKVLRGSRGMAGHVGHMMIDPDGPRCACGGMGCFEMLASGTSFGARGKPFGFSNGAEIAAAARQGNGDAMRLVDQEADLLAYGFASLIHLYSPEILVMGGGVSQALDLMQNRIEAHTRQLTMTPFHHVEIRKAGLGDDAGLIGAAVLAQSLGAL